MAACSSKPAHNVAPVDAKLQLATEIAGRVEFTELQQCGGGCALPLPSLSHAAGVSVPEPW